MMGSARIAPLPVMAGLVPAIHRNCIRRWSG